MDRNELAEESEDSYNAEVAYIEHELEVYGVVYGEKVA